MPIYPSNKSSITTKKKKRQNKTGIVLVCVFSLLVLELIFNIIPFFNTFIYGVFGLSVYPISLFFISLGVMNIMRVKTKLQPKEITYLILCFVCLLGMAHIFTSSDIINNSYRMYLADTFNCNKVYTAGGVIFSFLIYPLFSITHTAGVTVALAIILLLFLCLFIDSMYKKRQTQLYIEDSVNNVIKNTQSTVSDIEENVAEEQVVEREDIVPYDEDVFITDDEPEVEESVSTDKLVARRILGLDKEPYMEIDDEDEDLFLQDTQKDNFRPQMVVHDDVIDEPIFDMVQSTQQRTDNIKNVDNAKVMEKYERDKKNKDYLDDIMGRNVPLSRNEITSTTSEANFKESAKQRLFGVNSNDNIFANNSSRINNNYIESRSDNKHNVQSQNDNIVKADTFNTSNVSQNKYQEPNSDIYDEQLTLKSFEKNKTNYIDRLNKFDTASAGIAKAKDVYTMQENTSRVDSKPLVNNVVNVNEINQIKPKKEKVKRKPYVKPPFDLLETYRNDNIAVEDNTEKAIRLEATLDSFRIPAKVCSVARGPSFTRFELTMPVGISVKKIDNLVPDMQMALACKGAIRTEIPIPGKNAFGVEIPNEQKETVGLKDIIDSYEFQNSKYSTSYGLGKDISNNPIVGNIEKMPHLLVAGTTGSGKSVCLNSMLISLLYKSGPEDLRLILVDPKRLEFSMYNGLPHLLVPNVITDKEKAMNAFDWLIDEMNRRINFFDSLKAGIRNLDEYNSSAKVKSGELEKMPRIIAVVDELNELMMQTRKEMESKIVRIAQLSRAVGIHLVLATQRPSVDVITGLVKSNLPSRIAFAVSSFNDSMTILGQGGAENLLGFGDMLYAPVGTNKPIRLQGAFLKNSEVERVIEFIKANNDCIFDEEVEEAMFNRNSDTSVAEGMANGGGGTSNNVDPLMKDVLRFAIKSGGISTTRVQRFLRIGYPRAAKIIDDMEALNYISKKDDKNNRVIFMTEQEFEEVFEEDF